MVTWSFCLLSMMARIDVMHWKHSTITWYYQCQGYELWCETCQHDNPIRTTSCIACLWISYNPWWGRPSGTVIERNSQITIQSVLFLSISWHWCHAKKGLKNVTTLLLCRLRGTFEQLIGKEYHREPRQRLSWQVPAYSNTRYLATPKRRRRLTGSWKNIIYIATNRQRTIHILDTMLQQNHRHAYQGSNYALQHASISRKGYTPP